MPFSGTGSFTLVSGNPVVTGTNISSVTQNNTMSDFANGFGNCVTRDGQSPPTANLPMGGQRHTGAGNASGSGEYLVYGQALPISNASYISKPAVAAVVAIRDTSAQTLPQNSISTCVFNTETADRASNYDTATGIFTAPVAGIYLITASLRLQNNTVSTLSYGGAFFSKNNTDAIGANTAKLSNATEFASVNAGSNPFDVAGCHQFLLSASDTLRVKVEMGASGGAGLNMLIGSAMSITFWG